MKRTIFLAIIVLSSVLQGFSQKYAYVDTEYILGKIPEFVTAQETLNELSKDYQKEIEAKYADVDKLYKAYQSEKVLLSEDMRRKKEEVIIAKEKEAKELQKRYFGQEGDLFKKRQELIKPIQDQVFNAVKEIGESGNYAVVFDIAAGATLLYTNPKYDKSDDVLKKLGF